MPGFHHSVAVLLFPLRKFRKNYERRKNYVAYVKNSVAPLLLSPAVCAVTAVP